MDDAPAGWPCPTCTFLNVPDSRVCALCRQANPTPPTAAERAAETERNRARIALISEARGLLHREPHSQEENDVRGAHRAVRAVREGREGFSAVDARAAVDAIARARLGAAAASAARRPRLRRPPRRNAAAPDPTAPPVSADANVAELDGAEAEHRVAVARDMVVWRERQRALAEEEEAHELFREFRERRRSMSGVSSSSDGASSAFGGGGSIGGIGGSGERPRDAFAFASRAELEKEERDGFLRSSSAGGETMMRWEDQHFTVRGELLQREHARAQRRLKEEHARELQRCRARIGVGSEVACALVASTARRLGPSATALAAELGRFRGALKIGDVVLSSSRPGECLVWTVTFNMRILLTHNLTRSPSLMYSLTGSRLFRFSPPRPRRRLRVHARHRALLVRSL